VVASITTWLKDNTRGGGPSPSSGNNRKQAAFTESDGEPPCHGEVCIFECHGQVPTKGLAASQRHILGAVFLYQLLLLHRFQHHQDLRLGLKACLRAA